MRVKNNLTYFGTYWKCLKTYSVFTEQIIYQKEGEYWKLHSERKSSLEINASLEAVPSEACHLNIHILTI